jgi:hypothetical protein
MTSRIREHAGFWATLGGGVAAVGGILIGVGLAQVLGASPRPTLWSNGWFVGGIVAFSLGVIALLASVVVYF